MATIYLGTSEKQDVRAVVYCGSRTVDFDTKSIHLDEMLIMDWQRGWGYMENHVLFAYLPGVNVLEYPPMPGDYHPSVLADEHIQHQYAQDVQEALERAVSGMVGEHR